MTEDISGRPSKEVAAEFRKVSQRAVEFLAALGRSNRKPDNCPEQVDDICQSLSRMEDGNTDGGRVILAYAENRLPDLRRLMFPIEEQDVESGATARDDVLDDKLSLLIAAVSTAKATIDREKGSRPAAELPPSYVPNDPPSPENNALAREARENADRLAKLEADAAQLQSDGQPVFEGIRREAHVGLEMHILAESELRAPEIVPGWLRLLRRGIASVPTGLRKLAGAIKVTKKIGEPFVDQYHEIKHDLKNMIAKHIDRFADNLGKAADAMEGKGEKSSSAPEPIAPSDLAIPDDVEQRAQDMILRGETPPAHWIPAIRNLGFFRPDLTNLMPLAGLKALQHLHLMDTGVSDLTPLAGLTALRWLTLVNAGVSDLTPLSGTVALEKLTLLNVSVSDLTPLAGLTKLNALSLADTSVSDITPLSGIVALERLSLFASEVYDLTPLRGLPRLVQVDVENRARAKQFLPQLGPGWRIMRKKHGKPWHTLRRDVPGVDV